VREPYHTAPKAPFIPVELTMLAHLYRGEVYRSAVWHTRLDATTNWAVVATGLALSLTFGSPTASPLPLVLVGLVVAVFLCIEARRYRFFDFWRIRAHILEINARDLKAEHHRVILDVPIVEDPGRLMPDAVHQLTEAQKRVMAQWESDANP
jgi:hypothetical protein